MCFICCAEFLVCRDARCVPGSWQQKRLPGTAVCVMTLVQTDCNNVVRLTRTPDSANLIRRIVRRTAQACGRVVLSVWHGVESAAQWSRQRSARTRLTVAERARQRRTLA